MSGLPPHNTTFPEGGALGIVCWDSGVIRSHSHLPVLKSLWYFEKGKGLGRWVAISIVPLNLTYLSWPQKTTLSTQNLNLGNLPILAKQLNFGYIELKIIINSKQWCLLEAQLIRVPGTPCGKCFSFSEIVPFKSWFILKPLVIGDGGFGFVQRNRYPPCWVEVFCQEEVENGWGSPGSAFIWLVELGT